MESLAYNDEIDINDITLKLKKGLEILLNNSNIERRDFDKYKSDSINNHTVKVFVQPVEVVIIHIKLKIYIDSICVDNIAFSIIEGRLMNKEFEQINNILGIVKKIIIEKIKNK